ncbi:DNA polymerase [Pyramidobacter piscolens]|uniref:DNA polymerase n=1 Tax=Pyramidobacter piscolens TaxID=638849 RepID=UPI002AB2548A|nr:DNA polymerase [Pyramidobacter piscolens]
MTTFSRRVLHLDLETYCDEDLGKCGVHKYAASPSCEILLLSYALDDGPVVTCDALESGFKKKYETFRRLFVDKDIVKAAHNAVFEMTILSRKGFVIRPDEWLCTMALANYAGLPPSLAALSNILHLFDKGKMTIGTQLINYFSKPCKPTKANGGRTRNLPKDDPERWAAFKEYNRRDVEAEREVYKRLIKFDQPEAERRVFLLDYEINRRGIGVDRRLAEQAVKMSEQITDAAVTELKRLTGLGNPNSVVQFKSWLAEKGVAVESLTKTAAETLRDSVEDPLIKRAVALKLSISKASVKKYDAVLRAYNASSEIEDFGTVNGAFQYYGANRTGRWAGRLVQLQNLRRNSLPNLDVARTLVRSGDYDDLRLAYDDYDTSEILGQLVRTAFIPTPGNKFIVADFSAIEARVIAWLAGERWRMEAFARGEDIYKSSYSQAFGVPIDQITKEMRQKGKIMELACIAEGSPVLTDKGLVPIEQVSLDMKLWDGIEFVRHEGVIYRGEKEVITYDGLTATGDHLVYVRGQSRPIHFGEAARSGARLIQSGTGRNPIRMGGNHFDREALPEKRLAPALCPDSLHRMRNRSVAKFKQPATGKIKGLPALFPTVTSTQMAFQASGSRQTALHKSTKSPIPFLRRKRYSLRIHLRTGSGNLDSKQLIRHRPIFGARPDRQQQRIRPGKSPICPSAAKSSESANYSIAYLQSERMAIFGSPSTKASSTRTGSSQNHRMRQGSRPAKTKKLASDSGKTRVYDIKNAGKRHRYTVSGRLVHNCGYGGSVGALKAFGADRLGLNDAELKHLVNRWRSASPNIVRFWRRIENACKDAIDEERTTRFKPGLKIDYKTGRLKITLPSGRSLYYQDAKLEPGKYGPMITYMNVNQVSRRWDRADTHGGKLVENITQAVARDCLAAAMLRLNDAGYRIVSHIHDEVVIDAPQGAKVSEVEKIVGESVLWAPGLLLTAHGYEGRYYFKD